LLSDIQEDLKLVEQSLSRLSSHVGYVMRDGADVTSKLYGLEEKITKLEKVRKIRRKLESKQVS
jgi:hypothetical protein